MSSAIRRRTYRRPGRLVPPGAVGLRARAVRLKPGQQMDWHSTRAREELLVALRGSVGLEVQECHLGLASPGELRLRRQEGRLANEREADAEVVPVTGPARTIGEDSTHHRKSTVA